MCKEDASGQHLRHEKHRNWNKFLRKSPSTMLGPMLWVSGLSASFAQGAPSLRDWTLDDSIRVRYFSPDQVIPQAYPDKASPTDFITASPDGRYFFFMSHRGLLSRDSNEYELSVYAVESVRRALTRRSDVKPLKTVTFESLSSTIPAISHARWQEDSSGVFLNGMSQSGVPQAYRIDLKSGAVKQLTDRNQSPNGIDWFVYRDGGVVFKSHGGFEEAPVLYPLTQLEYRSDGTVVPGRWSGDTFVAWRDGPARKLEKTLNEERYWIGPGGHRAVALQTVAGGSTRFVLVNLEHGTVQPMPGIEVGHRGSPVPQSTTRTANLPPARLPSPQALWSTDARHVVLVDATVSGSRSSDSNVVDVRATADTGYVVDYEPDTGRATIIARMVDSLNSHGDARFVTAVRWLIPAKQFLLTQEGAGRPATSTAYTLRGDRWVGGALAGKAVTTGVEAAGLQGGLSVLVRQTANDPPMVVASDGRHELALTPPDPALEGLWRARMEPVQWQERDGKMHSGGLMLPRRFARGTPVPLVIQTYWYLPQMFLPDGVQPTAYAAQPLVARGMAVLQIDLIGGKGDPKNEGSDYVARVDAAVEALAAQKLIDPAHVGVTGFSRGGYLNLYAITHPGRTHLAAAVIADSFKRSYSGYLTELAKTAEISVHASYEMVPGGAFWERKGEWLEYESTFNVDRVRTPALFTEHGRVFSSSFEAQEIIGAFRRNGRPLEYLFLPQGHHYLFRPRERLAEMQSLVEWMAFWLQGQSPADPERAARWKAMSAQQQEVLKQPERPHVKWVAIPFDRDAEQGHATH